MTFDFDGRIGRANNIQLKFELRHNVKEILPKPKNFTGERLEFLKKTIADWV